MKPYIIVLFVLKLSLIIQICLILAKIETETDIPYLISDFFFKICLGLFLIFYFYISGSPSFQIDDELFISFGGGLLVFDAFYNVLPKLLAKFGLYFDPYTLTLSSKPITKGV